LGNGNREKKKGSKKSDPVSMVVDLCNANGSQGLQNPPGTDETSMGATGWWRSLEGVRVEEKRFGVEGG
jgi:hypothetical protein